MRIRRFVELVAWLVTLAVIVAVLVRLDRGALALPASNWQEWFRTQDVTTVAFALLRVAALLVALYLLITTLLLSVVTALRVTPLVSIFSTLAGPLSRRVTQRALGLGLVASLSVPALAGAVPATTTDVPTLRALTADEPDPTFAPAPAPAVETHPVPHTHVVLNGENLWTIADLELRDSLGRSPDNEELRQYWLQVIENNRSQLVDHPDLIQPGQIIRLPNAG